MSTNVGAEVKVGLVRNASASWLNGVERLGNALPDPVMIFIVMIVVLMVVSSIGATMGWQAVNPVTGELLVTKSLMAEDIVRKLLNEMSRTYTGFAPLGLALVMGAGVADHSGLLGVLVRASLQRVPLTLLTPTIFLVGMLTTHAVDAGAVVWVSLDLPVGPGSGVVYHLP